MMSAELLLETIDLGVGDPHDPPPDVLVRELSERILDARASHYANPSGEPELIDAAVGYYRRTHSVTLSPLHQVCATHGARPALQFGLKALGRPGAPVGYFSPAYVGFAPLIEDEGMVAYPIHPEVWLENGSELEASIRELRGGALLLNSPHNPTGVVLSAAEFRMIARITSDYDVKVISDAVYTEIYESGGEIPQSYLRYDPNALEVISISKTFRACGWRVGVVTGEAAWIGRFKEMYEVMNGVPYAAQLTSALALNLMPEVSSFRTQIAQRRAVLIERVQQLGFVVDTTRYNTAGLFVWARLPRGAFPSSIAATRHFADLNVKVAAGSSFGLGGEGYIRFSLNVPPDQIIEAIDRISI